MPAVTAVHEDMHQWAGQKEQPREEWNDMGPMFRDQEIAGYREKPEQDDVRARSEEAWLAVIMVVFHFSPHYRNR
jgi:hypothetical protein